MFPNLALTMFSLVVIDIIKLYAFLPPSGGRPERHLCVDNGFKWIFRAGALG